MKMKIEKRIKFTIYNFLGQEKAYYVVDMNLGFKFLTNSATKIAEPLAIDYSYQIFISESAREIKCTAGILKIDNLKRKDTGIIYKYKQISQETYRQLEIPVVQNHQAVYAFVKANLVEGNLNFAKYALFSTGNANLIVRHSKALTNQQLANFASDVEIAIFEPEEIRRSQLIDMEKNAKISLLELIKILEEHRHNIIVNLKHLRDNYRYKSVQMLKGIRDANGNLVKPWLTTEYIDDGEYVGMGSFEMNRNTATINMLVTRKVKLVKASDKTPIIEIAGLLANDLTSYNNYTIVGDGEINIKSLKVKISSKKTFDVLRQKGVIDAETFDFRCCYTVDLNLPLVPLDREYSNIDGLFNQIAEVKILASIISAHLKQESDTFVPEQLDELKKHYLSQHLYLNFPTTKAEGTVDTRISYKIDIGSKDILNLGKLYSANRFLERRYELYDTETGEIFGKPTLEMTLRENIAVRQKSLSSRMKITKVDELMKPIFDDFLGIEINGKVAGILAKVGDESLLKILQDKASQNLENTSSGSILLPRFNQSEQYKGISSEQYKEIFSEQYKGISSEQYKGISSEQYKGISSEQYKGISSEQYKGISSELYKGISSEQYKGISSEQDKGIFSEQDKGISSEQYKGISSEQDARTTKLKKQERIAALTAAKIKLEEYVEKIYQDRISPLVFYIGSTGLLPDCMEGKAMSAIQLAAKYPNLHFSKDEGEGLFFEVGDSLIGVYEKVEYYSTKALVEVG